MKSNRVTLLFRSSTRSWSFVIISFFLLLCLCVGTLSNVRAQGKLQTRIDSLTNLLDHTQTDLEKLGVLVRLADVYQTVDTKKGEALAREAIELGESLEPTPKGLIARANNVLAGSLFYSSRVDEAEGYFLTALGLYNELADAAGQAIIIGNLGLIHYARAEYDESLARQLHALDLFEELADSLGMARTHGNIANIYMMMKAYEKALHYDSLALEMNRLSKDVHGQAVVLGNIANILADIDRDDSAKIMLNEAIVLYEKLGDEAGVARNLLNLSTIYEAERNYYKAFVTINRSIDISRKINLTNALVYGYSNRGVHYLDSYMDYDDPDSSVVLVPGSRQALLDSAIADFEQALRMSRAAGALDVYYQVSEALTQAYEYTGDYEAALIAYKDFREAKDSIYSTETAAQIEALTTEREVALKDKQIELDQLAVEKKRNERIYFIIGLALLSLVLGFIYRNFINQKRANSRLGKLNEQVMTSNNLLEEKNVHLSQTLTELKETQDNLIESEKQKENANLRARISQDIHDDISSGLTKISWLAESLKAKAGADGSESKLIEKINRFSREAVSNLGEIIWSTNPERDNIQSLLAYIRSYINSLLEDTPIEAQFEFPDEFPQDTLNPKLRRNLYLSVKEAVNNAMKYSEAKKLKLVFTLTGTDYKMTVTDNGVGFKDGEVKGLGNGIRNMQRRMQDVKGQFQIETKENIGTQAIFSGTLY